MTTLFSFITLAIISEWFEMKGKYNKVRDKDVKIGRSARLLTHCSKDSRTNFRNMSTQCF